MWYRWSAERSQDATGSKPGGKKEEKPSWEEKIAHTIADRVVRNRLFLRGDYIPNESHVAQIVAHVLRLMNERYGGVEHARRVARSPRLTPLIENAVDDCLRQG